MFLGQWGWQWCIVYTSFQNFGVSKHIKLIKSDYCESSDQKWRKVNILYYTVFNTDNKKRQ